MFIGGYVSAAGLGLTCPEWPLCPNGVLPNEEFISGFSIEKFVDQIAEEKSSNRKVSIGFDIGRKYQWDG